MKDILNKIYEEKLLDALLFTDNYSHLRNIPGVLDILLTEEFINKFLSTFNYIYEDNKRLIPTNARKNSLLMVLNDIRFNYQYRTTLEKSTIIDRINSCISFINSSDIKLIELVYEENNSKDKVISTITDINLEDLCTAFCFYVVYYYLQNAEEFKKEALPLFSKNIGYYISGLYDIIDAYPQIFQDKKFLLRTKEVVVNSIDLLKENRQVVHKEEYKLFMKELKRLNSFLK